MIKEYDGLDIDKAIEKLKSKIRWDDEDIAFANARAEYFSPAELEIIQGGEQTSQPAGKGSNEMSLDGGDSQPPAGNVAGNGDTKAPEDLDPNKLPAEGKIEATMKMSLETLQGMAANLEIDTAGTKAELVERINAKLAEPKE